MDVGRTAKQWHGSSTWPAHWDLPKGAVGLCLVWLRQVCSDDNCLALLCQVELQRSALKLRVFLTCDLNHLTCGIFHGVAEEEFVCFQQFQFGVFFIFY